MFFVYAMTALHVFLKEIYFSENKLLCSHCFPCFCERTPDKISLSNEHLSCVMVGGYRPSWTGSRGADNTGGCLSWHLQFKSRNRRMMLLHLLPPFDSI